jgi:hypothetical protein
MHKKYAAKSAEKYIREDGERKTLQRLQNLFKI